MDLSKPKFWDDPEGEIIRWIAFGDIYSKDQIKQNYLKTIKRRPHGFDKKISSKLGFAKCWKNISEQHIFWEKPDNEYWVIPDIYRAYWKVYEEGSPEEIAEIEELYLIDDQLIKRAYQLIKRPMIISAHHYISGLKLHNFLCDIINFAKRRIIIVSPYVHKTDITEKLGRIKRGNKNLEISFVYRITKPGSFLYEEQDDAVTFLVENKINIIPTKEVHAKILVIDDRLAVISSYNWTSYPATGDSWEAGIVTFDIEVIDEILKSLHDIN